MNEILARKVSGALDLLAVLEVGALCVLVALGIAATAALLRALAPAAAASLDAACAARSGGRRLLLGIVNGPALLLVSLWLISRGNGPPGLALLLALVALAVAGLVAELGALGKSLLGRAPGGPPDLPAMLAGGCLFALANLLPVAGQILVLGILLMGIGTAVSWLLGRRP